MAEIQITAWKALLFKDRIKKVAPIHWDIDLTMVCNHRCPGCFYIGLPDDGYDASLGVYRNMKTGTMLKTDVVMKTISDLPSVGGKAITFVGGGEPTLHRDIVEILEHVHNTGLKFGLISHFGLNYKPALFKELLNASWVRISVNASNAETYSKMQGIRKEEFYRVLENVKTLADMGGNVGVSFLIHPDNIYEIPNAAELFSNVGAKYIQYKPYITYKKEELWKDIEPIILNKLSTAHTFASDKFQVLDQFSSRKQQLQDYWNKKPCGQCWVSRFNPKITADGKIYQCCELAYSDIGILGDLYKDPLETIVESKQWQDVEAGIDTNVCPPCWERNLNRAINDGSFQTMAPPKVTVDAEFV